jgi:hypothetical protein
MTDTKDDHIDSFININEKIAHIIELYELISNIKGNKTRNCVKQKFNQELDFMIERMEDHYYKNVLRHRKTMRHTTKTQQDIYSVRKTIDKMMPYMLAIQIAMNMNNDTDNQDYIPQT